MSVDSVGSVDVARARMEADLLIDREWATGAAGTLDNVDPGAGRTVGAVTLATPAQVEAAITAAETAFGPWCDTLSTARGQMLKRASQLLAERVEEAVAIARRLHASNIGINQLAPSLPDVPLGGLGNSGYGYEGGLEGILAFTQLRLVSETTSPP